MLHRNVGETTRAAGVVVVVSAALVRRDAALALVSIPCFARRGARGFSLAVRKERGTLGNSECGLKVIYMRGASQIVSRIRTKCQRLNRIK